MTNPFAGWDMAKVQAYNQRIADAASSGFMRKPAKPDQGNPNPARHKFGAIRTERDGMKFDSTKEAARYDDLKLLMKAGEVSFFIRQVPFHLPGNVKYLADFVVFWADGHVSVEDVKGCKTSEYIAKKKMVEALYPVTIEEL